MKRTFYLSCLLLGIGLIACNKENQGAPVAPETNPSEVSGNDIIVADIVPMTTPESKTTYEIDNVNNVAKFSWLKNDQFLMVVKNSAGELNHYRFTANADGASTEFDGKLPDGVEWMETNFAVYPANVNGFSYASGNISDGVKVSLLGTAYNQNSVDPLAGIPMVGVKQADGHYQFHAAMGVLKFTVKNVPADMRHICLYTVAPAKLQGTFALDDEGYVYMTAGGNDYLQRYIDYTPTAQGEDVSFYIPVPIGTVPAGSYIIIQDSSYGSIVEKRIAADIASEKNTLTEVAPFSCYFVEDLVGTYSTAVTQGSYAYNYTAGDFVLAASDDASKGNIMITKFAGVEGKLYGTYNPKNFTMTFSKDQVFGANPYSDTATEYPQIALVSHNGSSAVDIEFKVTNSGKIKFTGADLGFRAVKDLATWTSTYGGAWPWSLGYKTFVATKQ